MRGETMSRAAMKIGSVKGGGGGGGGGMAAVHKASEAIPG